MKWLPAFLCLLWPLASWADDPPKSELKPLRQTPPNIQIIDGKKFFSLANARHFTGSFTDPKALSVMHHPRPEGTIASRRVPLAPFSAGTAALPMAGGTGDKDKDNVLSIFAPDDKLAVYPPETK